ncbi:MAG: P-II family nitrogen regulator [Vicinamibacteria bacterium]
MIELKAIIQPFQLNQVIEALQRIEGLPGVTVSEVRGFGRSQGVNAQDRIVDGGIVYARKAKLEIVIPEGLLDTVLHTILHEAHTGNPGDGKVFVSKVLDVVRIRTGERGDKAI